MLSPSCSLGTSWNVAVSGGSSPSSIVAVVSVVPRVALMAFDSVSLIVSSSSSCSSSIVSTSMVFDVSSASKVSVPLSRVKSTPLAAPFVPVS